MNRSEHPMNQQTQKRPLLADTLPIVRSRASAAPAEQDEPEPAAQVPTLAIYDRCRCGDGTSAAPFTADLNHKADSCNRSSESAVF